MSAGMIRVQFATGVREIPLTEEVMKTMTAYFDLEEDGVYRFSETKQKALLGIK